MQIASKRTATREKGWPLSFMRLGTLCSFQTAATSLFLRRTTGKGLRSTKGLEPKSKDSRYIEIMVDAQAAVDPDSASGVFVQTIQQQQLEGLSISIDDTHFVDCTLINCVLEYSGTPIAFERTVMRGCRYVFFGSARSTVQFLQGVGLMDGSPLNWGEFSDQVH